jgi:hypothetical protein
MISSIATRIDHNGLFGHGIANEIVQLHRKGPTGKVSRISAALVASMVPLRLDGTG